MLLTQQHVLDKVTLATQSKVMLVDRSWDEVALQPTTSLNIPADVTRLMYMIFTSGGLPKSIANATQETGTVPARSQYGPEVETPGPRFAQ